VYLRAHEISTTGTKVVRKARGAYVECTASGTVDDLSEPFPFTSSGTQWAGVTDRVMGGVSSGSLTRETVEGRLANVLRGKVSLDNAGGFVQMATDLALDPAVASVDASQYDGIEIELYYGGSEKKESFNVHLRNLACIRQFSSYRATVELESRRWTRVRLGWDSFRGYGPGAENIAIDPSTLRRLGVVAIGKKMIFSLALTTVHFFTET